MLAVRISKRIVRPHRLTPTIRVVLWRVNNYELADRAQRGDKSAMNQLLDNCTKRIGSAVIKTLAKAGIYDQPTIEDAWQLAAIHIVKGIQSYEARNNADPCSWMYKVARNRTLNYVEREHPGHLTSLEEIRSFPTSRSVEELALDAAAIKRLADRMDTSDFELIWLKYFERLTYPEIAKELGVRSAETVRSRVKKAEVRARQWLDVDL